MTRLWKVAIWDLVCCLKGEFLPYDWDGEDIVEGHIRHGHAGKIMGQYILAPIMLVADTEHHTNHFGLQHWGTLRPCNWCTADRIYGSNRLFSDFRPGAQWMRELLTVEQLEDNMIPHALFQAHALVGITLFRYAWIFCMCLI